MSDQRFCLTLMTAALGCCVASMAMASPPAEMPGALVDTKPNPAHLGDARFATTKAALPIHDIAHLSAPTQTKIASLKQLRLAQTKQGMPLQIGFVRYLPKPQIDLAQLRWTQTANGLKVTRLKVSSAQSQAIRAAIALTKVKGSRIDLDQIKFRFAGNDGRIFEETGIAFIPARWNLPWSPFVEGDAMTIEIALPQWISPSQLQLRIPQISHLDVSPTANKQQLANSIEKEDSKEDSCELNTVCVNQPSQAFVNATKAVARIVFTSEGNSFLCTGTLLDNDNSPKRPLFWTAAHCVSSPRVASTLQSYWFYESNSCQSDTPKSETTVLSGGARLLYRNTRRDTTLLELKSSPPVGAFYAGWSRLPIDKTGTPVIGIHHPRGGLMRYSVGKVDNVSIDFYGRESLYQIVWEKGVTEMGSSGSGIFTMSPTGQLQLRGGLLGGRSSCLAQSEPDYYSRIADVFPRIQMFFSPSSNPSR